MTNSNNSSSITLNGNHQNGHTNGSLDSPKVLKKYDFFILKREI
jgi:hypothetical protein